MCVRVCVRAGVCMCVCVSVCESVLLKKRNSFILQRAVSLFVFSLLLSNSFLFSSLHQPQGLEINIDFAFHSIASHRCPVSHTIRLP